MVDVREFVWNIYTEQINKYPFFDTKLKRIRWLDTDPLSIHL